MALDGLPAQVLVVSRPLEPYKRYLPSAKTFSMQEHNEDIKNYVMSTLQEHLGLTVLLGGNKKRLQKIVSKIQEKAQGMCVPTFPFLLLRDA